MSLYRNLVFLFSFVCMTGNLSVSAQAVKKTTVPDVVGMKVKEAKKKIRSKNMQIGAIIYASNAEYSDSSIVIKQNPSAKNANGTSNLILKQKLIDLWVANLQNSADTLKSLKEK